MRHFLGYIAFFLTVFGFGSDMCQATSNLTPVESFQIRIEKAYYCMPGHLVGVAVKTDSDGDLFGGFFNPAGQTIRNFAGHSRVVVVDIIRDGADNNGRTVASGIYFYRTAAGSFSQSRKMTLLK